MAMSRMLVVLGLVIAAAGLLWPWLVRIGLGRLPGDILIERPNFSFYAPVTTGLLISIFLSVILWLLKRWPLRPGGRERLSWRREP